MELRHLRSFVVVAEEGNITRAAQRLHISQPPLTRQIQQLEAELDTALFERTSRGVELTDAGRVLLEDARQVLRDVEHAEGRARRAGEGHAGTLEIGLFGTAIFGAIPMLLRAHRERFPEVSFKLHNMVKEEQIEALKQDRISLAFNRLMRPVPGLVSEVLLSEPLLVALPAEHPLAARPAVHLADLDGVPMVLFPTGYRPSFIDRVQDVCARVGFTPTVQAEVADVVHGIAMIATSGAACLVPFSATNLHVPGVRYVPLLDEPALQVGLCCITRDSDPSPVLAELLRTMRTTAPHIRAHQLAQVRGPEAAFPR